MNYEQDVQRVVHFFETLKPATLGNIDTIYAHDAYFKDPFNEVHNLAGIEAIFEHMFRQLKEPRFVVATRLVQDDHAFLTWQFLFHAKRLKGEQCVRGASHLRFNEEGFLVYHRDYWDAAEELYEKLPALGSLMRLLRRQLSAASVV